MVVWSALVGLVALAGTHETGLGVGVGWHDSPRQVVIGIGPQLTHRYWSQDDRPWWVGGAVERLWLVVPTWGATAAGGIQRVGRRWQPGAAVEVAMYPSRLRKLTPEHPEPTHFPATSLRVRLAPLCFAVSDSATVTALAVAPGLGLDTPADTLAFGLTVFSVQHRW
jgi:hypothetical protein